MYLQTLAMHTYFLGLSVGVILQFAEEGVLLGQQNFNVLHTHFDYSGADIWLKSVDALVKEMRDKADTLYQCIEFSFFPVTL